MEEEVKEMKYVLSLNTEQMVRNEKEKERLRETFDTFINSSKSSNKQKVMVISSQLGPSDDKKTKVTTTKYDNKISAFDDSTISSKQADAQIIDTLRKQVDMATDALKRAELENKRLQAAVTSREKELERHAKIFIDNGSDTNFASSKMEQLMTADGSNRRIIDQLNSQVDFLNEQLALREAQLVDASEKLMIADSTIVENLQKSKLLEDERSRNSQMSAKIIALEKKLADITETIDPDGSISVDDLYDRMSQYDSASVASGPKNYNAGNDSVGKKSQLTQSYPESKPSISNKASMLTSTSLSANQKQLQQQASSNPIKTKGKLSNPTMKQTNSLKSGSGDYSETDMVFTQLNVERKGLMENVGTLNEAVESMRGNESLLKERLKRGEEKIAQLKVDLEECQNQLKSCYRSITDRDAVIMSLQKELDNKENLAKDAVSKLGDISVSSETKEAEISKYKSLLEAEQKQRDRYEQLLETLRSELALLRKEKSDAIMEREESTGKLKRLEKELEYLNHNSDKTLRDLTDNKTEVVKLRLRIDELDADIHSERSKADFANKRSSELEETLSRCKVELAEASQKLTRLETSQSSSSILDQMKLDAQSLRSRIEQLEEEKRNWGKERAALEQDARVIASANQAQSIRSNEVVSLKTQLTEEVMSKETEISHLRKIIFDKDLEMDQASAQLKAQEQICESLKSSLKEHQSQLRVRTEGSELLASEVHTLELRLSELQDAYDKARMIGEDASTSQTMTTHRVKQMERDNSMIMEQLEILRREKEVLENGSDSLRRQLDVANRRAGADREDLRKAMAEKAVLENRVQELKVLIANMEASARSHAHQNTRLAAALEDGNEGLRKLEQEAQHLKHTIEERDTRINELQEALQNLDEERDKLQANLDELEEASESRELQRQHQETQIYQLKQLLEKTEKRLQNSSLELINTQKQANATESRLNSVKQELLETKRRFAIKSAEVGGAAEDIMLMTKENQALTSDLAETASERDRLKVRVSELAQGLSTLEQSRRAIEIERNDLLESYRAALQEKRHLENELLAQGTVKQRVGAAVQQLEGQNAELRGQLSSTQLQEARWAAEKSALTRQAELMNEQLVRYQQKIDAVESDNRRMMQDLHQARQTKNMLDERIQVVMKRASAAADANKILSAQLHSIQVERDAMRALVGVERNRANDQTAVAAAARASAATFQSNNNSPGIKVPKPVTLKKDDDDEN